MSRIRSFFVSPRGGIRLGWLMLTAAVLYVLAAVGIYGVYWRVYGAMMDVWCVTAENVARAPGWVQFLYGWSNVIAQLLESAALIGFAALLGRMAGIEREKGAGVKGAVCAAGLAAGCVLLIWLILLLTGSVRLGWKLSRPSFSVNTAALLLTTLAAAAAEGCFLYGAVRGMLKKRLPIWAALIATAAINVLMNGLAIRGAWISCGLSAIVCCLLAEKYGMISAVGFRFAWSFLDRAVLGFAGAAGALYETYPVNLYWFSGGNAGIMSGFLTMFVLTAAFFLLLRITGFNLLKGKKRSKSPS